jgi:hypothetical protein
MTAQKLTDLTATTASPLDTDIILVTEDPAGDPVSKKTTMANALRLAHGYVQVTGGSASQSLSATTWTKVSQFTAELNYDARTTASHSDDSIILVNAGRYMADWMCSFTGATTSEYRLAVYWNGSIQCVPAITTTTSTNEHCVTVRVPVNASSANQKVEAYVYSDGANAFAVKESVLTVERVA